ncbi:MAG: GTP cyclohydrolase I FolE [Gammaproteobacteria bacterium]|nr:GTP cyclohydrolase I FolE [Gammaproteobacteria bacterium]
MPDKRRQTTDIADLEKQVHGMLAALGEDPGREGLLDTPARTARSLSFLTRGYEGQLEDIVNGALFTSANDEMVILKDIEMFSLCEHHMLPFFGRAHIGYLPDGKVIGVSKLARIVDLYAHRLQIQEQLTQQVAQAIQEVTGARGVGVIIEARHLCMMMRGVQKQNSRMKTSMMLGLFRSNASTRAEFLSALQS